MPLRWLYIASIVASLGCDGGKTEASAVVGAIDRYRAAENAEKTSFYEALARVPCSDPDACSAKAACVKVAEPTARGLQLQREVAADVSRLARGALAKDDPRARAMSAKLDESVALLATGEAAPGPWAGNPAGPRVKNGP